MEDVRRRYEQEMHGLAQQLTEALCERERLELELEQFKLRFTDLELAITQRLGEQDQRLAETQAQAARALAEQRDYYEQRIAALQRL